MWVLSRASWFQGKFDGVIVMTTPEKQILEFQDCVSAKQGGGRRTVTWNIGVSPMKINVSSWLTTNWYKKECHRAYTTRFQ